ncbi:MAG: histidine phosphatase family protein [Solirubrobacteraceae bacterium]|nr:histidine phosphatase family protein [Solirubrobacteraceae bacterium]
MSSSGRYLVLLRHGETEWTISGRHTGRSDIELTEAGREEARAAGRRLEGMKFDRVVTSPMHRAVETCRLAGFGDGATTDDALMEWDYGEYEGITTAEIQETVPDWSLFVQGCPGGESAADVGARVDPLVDAAREGEGNWLFAAHGHVLRVVGARWVGLPPEDGVMLNLGTAAVCFLGFEHDRPVITHWNLTGQVP